MSGRAVVVAALVGGCVGAPCPAGTIRGGDDCVDVFVRDPVAHGDVTRPLPGTSWQIQLQGELDPTLDVEVTDVDLFDAPDAVAAELAERGTLVCHLSVGTWEQRRDDADAFPHDAIGLPVAGWTGERWLDVADPVVRGALVDRLDLAVRKGCHAVDADDVDGWTRQTGFPATSDEALDFVRFLADAAHTRGLAFGLRNDPVHAADLLPWVDFAVVEQCADLQVCGFYAPFVDAGLAVLGIAYADDDAVLAEAAPTLCAAVPPTHDTLVKHVDLGRDREPCVTRRRAERDD